MPAGKQPTPLCDQFGFDTAWREAHIRLVGLQDLSRDQVRLLHDKVLNREALELVVDQFYAQIGQHHQIV